ncbi:MAG: hypothetical protein ACQKBU_10930 [Verrucomicrobiales bacterium]
MIVTTITYPPLEFFVERETFEHLCTFFTFRFFIGMIRLQVTAGNIVPKQSSGQPGRVLTIQSDDRPRQGKQESTSIAAVSARLTRRFPLTSFSAQMTQPQLRKHLSYLSQSKRFLSL